jgi:hypothetical protein
MTNDSVCEQITTEKRTASEDPAHDSLNGFFEISKIVESPDMLQCWVAWFKKLKIPCVIEKRKTGYALWRKGNEAGRDKSKGPLAPNAHNIIYSFAV